MATSSNTPSGAVTVPIAKKLANAGPDTCIVPRAIAALNLQQSQDAALGRDEPLLGVNDSGGTDSGYASAATTPDALTPEKSGTPESTNHTFQQEVLRERGLRRIFSRVPRSPALKIINKSIPQRVQKRFEDLNELFGDALLDHLIKSKVDMTAIRTISIKLMYVGTDETNAVPCVVILCDKAVSRKVKQFFSNKSVLAQYHNHEEKDESPYLDIKIYDSPPRLIAAIAYVCGPEVIGDIGPSAICGVPIQVTQSSGVECGTLGGLLVGEIDGVLCLVGVSAGHIVCSKSLNAAGTAASDPPFDTIPQPSVLEDQDNDNYLDDPDDQLIDSGFFDLDILMENDRPETTAAITLMPDNNLASKLQSNIGEVMVTSTSERLRDTPRNFDWCLIEFSTNWPNNIHLSKYTSERNEFRWRDVTCYMGELKEDRKVVSFCGVSGRREGTLASTMSPVLLAPGKRFIQTYTLSLTDRIPLQQGDCGSWVIDIETGVVYGHVVASDDFGEAYVVPLRDTIKDIETQSQLTLVHVPTLSEIQLWSPGRHPLTGQNNTPIKGSLNQPRGRVNRDGMDTNQPRMKKNPSRSSDPTENQSLDRDRKRPGWLARIRNRIIRRITASKVSLAPSGTTVDTQPAAPDYFRGTLLSDPGRSLSLAPAHHKPPMAAEPLYEVYTHWKPTVDNRGHDSGYSSMAPSPQTSPPPAITPPLPY